MDGHFGYVQAGGRLRGHLGRRPVSPARRRRDWIARLGVHRYEQRADVLGPARAGCRWSDGMSRAFTMWRRSKLPLTRIRNGTTVSRRQRRGRPTSGLSTASIRHCRGRSCRRLPRSRKQHRPPGIIAFGSHHQRGYSDVKGRPDGPASGQSLVEADAEPDGRAVAHRLPHTNNARNHRREGLREAFRPARIDDDASHVLADGFEWFYETIHGNDVHSPAIVFGRETSLLTAAVTDEL